MAKPTGKRENELTPDEQQKDGQVFTPDDGIDGRGPLTAPDYHLKQAPREDAKEAQNNEACSTGGDLPNGQQINVNRRSVYDGAIMYVLPIP